MQKEVSLDGVYSEINKLKEIVSELSRKKANMEQLDLLMN